MGSGSQGSGELTDGSGGLSPRRSGSAAADMAAHCGMVPLRALCDRRQQPLPPPLGDISGMHSVSGFHGSNDNISAMAGLHLREPFVGGEPMRQHAQGGAYDQQLMVGPGQVDGGRAQLMPLSQQGSVGLMHPVLPPVSESCTGMAAPPHQQQPQQRVSQRQLAVKDEPAAPHPRSAR